jgi:hypothetical protein
MTQKKTGAIDFPKQGSLPWLFPVSPVLRRLGELGVLIQEKKIARRRVELEIKKIARIFLPRYEKCGAPPSVPRIR